MGLEVNAASSLHLITMWIIYMASVVGMVSGSCYLTGNRPKSSAIDAENYRDGCADALMNQVHREFDASFTYLQMAAQFSQDDYYLPGVAKLFWEHADEEREHAKQFISYLRMRGSLENAFFGGEPIKPILGMYQWDSVSQALRNALDMEKAVSRSMKNMIDLCSQGGEDDPLAADWLTGTWLEEQLNGQRHLAGLINSLESFSHDHTELGEWLFAKEM